MSDQQEFQRRLRAYLRLQGKSSAYIKGFLEGYDYGWSAMSFAGSGFTGLCADCQLCGNNADMHYFCEAARICPYPERADPNAVAQQAYEEQERQEAAARQERMKDLTIDDAREAIFATRGNVSAASDTLEINPSTFSNWLKKHGLWPQVIALREAREK